MTREEFFHSVCSGIDGLYTISYAWKLYKQSQHALWMARAERAKVEKLHYHYRYDKARKEGHTYPCIWLMVEKWLWVEGKCLQKAKEFE